jgi:hypothetical protein
MRSSSDNPATGQLIAWVRIPVLLHTADTVIYVFYGNPNITASQANSTGVWDTNYQAVYHLTSTTAPDSTVYGNSGSLASVSLTTGEIDGGASLNGSSSYVQIYAAAVWRQLLSIGHLLGSLHPR